MFGLSKMIFRMLCTIAVLPLFTTGDARGQDGDTTAIGDEVTDDRIAEQEVVKRYEQLLRNRPQMGVAFDKVFDFHLREGSIRDLCEQLESAANKDNNGNLFELLGLLQLSLGNLDDAVTSLTHADRLLPKEPLVSLYLSRALKLKRQYAPALAALKDSIDRKPNQAVALEILKEFRQLKARGFDAEIANDLLSKFEQQFSSSPQVIEELADCLIEVGRPEAARPLYEKLIELTRDPQRRVELRIELARLLKRLGQSDQSLLELEQLLSQVKPDSWLHSMLLEQIEQLVEELHGAEGLVAYYQRNLTSQPDNVAGMVRLARVLRNRSLFEEAKTWLTKAIELAPTDQETLLAMVDLLEDNKQFESASNLMQQLTELDPTNIDYIVRWGRIAAIQADAGDPSTNSVQPIPPSRESLNAEAIWSRLLDNHENDPARITQFADLLQSVSLKDKALELYEKAVQASGGKIEYRELWCEQLIQADRREEARRVLADAITAAGDDRDLLIRISESLTRFNFRDEALQALEAACGNDSDLSKLMQLAKLQKESERFDSALDTLNRAAVRAERSADLTEIWYSQIEIYKKVSSRRERIVALEKSLEDGQSHSVHALQQLALLQAADGQPAEAASTAFRATSMQPESMQAWLLTALLQRDAGLRLREIESLGKLCELDAISAADYLQHIATIQFQLNQLDEALAVSEKLLAMELTTLQHYQSMASLCLQAKKFDQAVEILQRAVRVFPNDRSAWLTLALQLADLNFKPQSITATWRVLELSRDLMKQREAIDLLIRLHPGQPGVAELIESMKQFGSAHKRESEASLWTAWVLLSVDSEHASSELIANLIDRNRPQPELLQAAVELAVRNHDYAQAAEIQLRRCRVESTTENQLKLGELQWLAGDTRMASMEWQKVMRNRSNDLPVIVFAKELIDKSSWNVVADLVDVGVESAIAEWEFLALGMHANIQGQNFRRAAEFSEELLAIKLPQSAMSKLLESKTNGTELVPASATDRLAWLERAGPWQAALNIVDVTRAGYRTNQTNPRASQAATVRQLAIQRGATLRATPTAKFNIECFADARALAVLTRFGSLSRNRLGLAHEWMSYVAEAIESKDVGKLWDCVLVLEPASNRNVSFNSTVDVEYSEASGSTASRYTEVLDTLVALGESAAVELAINEIVSRRQIQHQLADRLSQSVPEMNANELARLQDLVMRVDGSGQKNFAGQVTLAVELLRSQRVIEGQQLLESALAAVTDSSRLATSARQFLSQDSATREVTSRMLLRAFELELESGTANNDLAIAISSFRDNEDGNKDGQAHLRDFLIEMVRLQGKHLAGLTPEQFFSDSRTNESRRAFRNFRNPTTPLPDRSSLLSASLRAALIDMTPTQLNKFIADINTDDALSKSEVTVQYFTASLAQAILNDPDRALAFLKQANEQQLGTEIVSLYEVWLLVANGRLEEARDVLNRIVPPSESILRECELWKMNIGTRLGNKEEALRAASALANLPLSVHENADVSAVLNKK